MNIKNTIVYTTIMYSVLTPVSFSYDLMDNRLYRAAEILNFTDYNVAYNNGHMIDVFGEMYIYKKVILNNGVAAIRSVDCNVKLEYGCYESLCIEHNSICYAQNHLYCDETSCTLLSSN